MTGLASGGMGVRMRERARIVVGSIGLAATLLLGSGMAAGAQPRPPAPSETQSDHPGGGGAGAPNVPDSAQSETESEPDPAGEATAPGREPTNPAPQQDPQVSPDAVPMITSWKTDVTVGMVGEGAVATVREAIAVAAVAPGESLNFTHTIHLAPLPESDADTRIADVSAVAVVDGQEQPADVEVRFSPITEDGYQPVVFVLRTPEGVEANDLTYKLSYTIVDPLIPLVDDPDRIVMAFTIGAVTHPHPIEHYAADFTIEPPLSEALAGGEVGCAVMRVDGERDECVLDGTNAGFSIVSSGAPLGRDEYVKFEAVFDLAALPDALEEQERKDRPGKPDAADALSLDAPGWTSIAAAIGLAGLGGAGLVTSSRRNRTVD